MWFKRKKKNRRFERPELLDVKLRSSQVRSARLRLIGLGLSLSFSMVVILFVLWRGGEWVLDRLIYENDAFAIQTIEVINDGVIAPQHFRRWATVKTGQNLLALDLARVKRDLELVPLVQSAAVERILPRTLRLRITEREPVAQAEVMQAVARENVERVTYHLDSSGYVMLPLDARLRAVPTAQVETLPTIVGMATSELRPGRQVESAQVRAALGLITQFDYSPMAGLAELERISVSTPQIIEVYTSHGAQIIFSTAQFETQLRRWHLVFDEFQKQGKAIAMLDLSISNNVPLRLVEAGPLAPLNPKPQKTSRNRKKNV